MLEKIGSKGQRLLSVLLAAMMLISVLPMNVSAAANSDGYIEVRTVEDLYNVRNDLAANYILMNDIDLSEATSYGGAWDYDGRGWNPIGSGDLYGRKAFSGIFDGNGHSVTGMRISVDSLPSGADGTIHIGLFANVSGTVKNLTVTGSIRASLNCTAYIGGVAADASGTISNCQSEIDILVYNYYSYIYLGGILGGASSATVTNCVNKGKIELRLGGDSPRAHIGGIVGNGQKSDTKISCSYNIGDISAEVDYATSGMVRASGIVSEYGTVDKCYNTASISVTHAKTSPHRMGYAYGIGGSIVSESYNIGTVSAVSARYAITGGTITNCYYLNGKGSDSSGATALTEAQMMLSSIYHGFDFTDTWVQNSSAVYPYPQLKSHPQDLRVIENVVLSSEPIKTEYEYGESLDLRGAMLTVSLQNEENQEIAVTDEMISGYDAEKPGNQTVTVTYLGHTVTFDVAVKEKYKKPIYTVEDLYNVRKDLMGSYILMNDIDLTDATAEGGAWDFYGNGWNPIGSGDLYGNGAFSGEFDGNNHKIIGMRIDVTTLPSGAGDKIYLGLFANITGSVHDLTFYNGAVSGSVSWGGVRIYAGALAGTTSNGTITNITNENTSISASLKNGGYTYSGGIVGYNSESDMNLCTNKAKIYADTGYTAGSSYAGGIAAYIYSATISKSYNNGQITSIGSRDAFAGGISAINYKGTIKTSYNTGVIKASDGSSNYTAGISQLNSTENNYATISQCYNIGTVIDGSAISSGNGTTANSYYLAGSGTETAGATLLNEAQMLMSFMYNGFDFDSVWTQNTDAVYPYPQLLENPQDLRVIEGIELISLPKKTTYAYGEPFDASGCKVKLLINSGEEQLTVTNDMVSGYDATKPGTQVLTISYMGETITFTVIVNEKVFIPIYTVEELYNVRDNLSGNYILMNDIDLTDATAVGGEWDFGGNGWNPIGSGDSYGDGAFTGDFNGNNHKITGMRMDVTIIPDNTVNAVYLGLFSNVAGIVRNLTVEGNIEYNYSKNYYIGSIASICSGTIEGCTSRVNITGKATERHIGGCVGGFVGRADSNAYISRCTNTGDIESYCNPDNYAEYSISNIASGIVGDGYTTITISQCYNTGDISAEATSHSEQYSGYASGISYDCTILDCYNTGKVEAVSTSASVHSFAFGIGGTPSRSYNVGTISAQNINYAISSKESTNCYYLDGTGHGSTGAIALTEAQMKSKTLFYGFDFTDIWTLNKFANHPYPQLINNVQDLNESASIVSVISWPAKTEYMTGDDLVLDGCAIDVTYVSGHKELLNVTADMISGYDNTKTGEQIITVTYRGSSDTFPVIVTERPEVIGVELISQPNESEFRVGTAFDFTGAQIKVTYSDNTSEVIDVTVDMTTGGNINHLGKQTITVSYYGKSDTFEITVTSVSISSLRLDAAPNKLIYLEGQELDMTGMVLVAVMNNETEKQVSAGYTVTGYSNEPGTHTVTIEYMGKTVTFDVTVESRSVVELVLKSAPNKTEYVAGQPFDPTGMMIVATYDNGDIEVVEDYELSGFDDVPGLKTVVATYCGKYVVFPVSIIDRVMTDFKIISYPAKLDYLQYDAFDATGLEVVATYNDGITEKVTDYKMIGYSSNPGTHTISIAYKGWVETFTVNVTPRILTNLVVETPTKLTYYLGEEFDATGLKVTACYNNGQQVVVDDYTITGFDSKTPGTKTIAIGYGGFTSAFSISVSERSVIETDGNFIVGKLVARLGDTVVIPVSVSKNPGLAGFTHTITFDPTDLKFVSASAVGVYAEGTVVVNDDNAESGEISILWVGPTDIDNDGDVYNLTFEVLETAADGNSDINISFDNNDNGNVSGENVIFGTVNGYVDVRSYWLGDLDGDRRYTMVDLLQLAQYVSGKRMDLTDKQKLSADVNEDGEIDIHDVIMLQQWLLVADMYTSSTFSLFSFNDESTTEVKFGDVTAKVGDEVIIPVEVKNNPGLATYRFRVAYDTEALEFLSAENGSIASNGTITSTTDPQAGTMTFLWYSTTNVTGDGQIALLKFRVSDSARGNYPLTATYLPEDMLNEDSEPIPYTVINGRISTGSTISGTIKSFGDPANAVTIKLLENGTEIDKTTSTNGIYSFDSVAPGIYTIEVSKKNHATRTYEITVAADDVAQNVEIWLYGDVTGDGQVRINDYAKVLAAVRGTEPLEGYSALCGDINGDGAIRINDYAQILAHVRGTSSLWD